MQSRVERECEMMAARAGYRSFADKVRADAIKRRAEKLAYMESKCA